MNDAAWDPAFQQRAFRCLMRAYAYPGRTVALAGDGAALLLALTTLVDAGTRLADPDGLVDALDRLRLGTEPVAPDRADFIVCAGRIPPRFEPRLGNLENPDQSATLLIQVDHLGSGLGLALRGPGIPDTETLRVAGLAPEWLDRRETWVAGFPLGVDLLLVDGRNAAALPRTTQVVAQGAE